MGSLAVQFGIGNPHSPANLLAPVLAILVSACLGGATILILGRVLPWARRTVRSRRRRRRAIAAAAATESRSRAMMDELCPYGWQAQLTLFSSAADLPADAPHPERDRVALEWASLGPGGATNDVLIRRIWAPTVSAALEAMVADRVTDDTLAQIEWGAAADGVIWPDA